MVRQDGAGTKGTGATLLVGTRENTETARKWLSATPLVGSQVHEDASAEAAVARLRRNPDVGTIFVWDTTDAGAAGEIEQLRRAAPHAALIAFASDEDAEANLLAAGADEVLAVKEGASKQWTAAIRHAHARRRAIAVAQTKLQDEQNLLASSDVTILELDQNGNIRTASRDPRGLDDPGTVLLGRDIVDLFAVDDRDAIRATMRAATPGEGPVVVTGILPNRRGNPRALQMHISCSQRPGEPKRYSATLLDVSRWAHEHAELKQELESLRSFVGQLPVPVYRTHRSGRIEMANPALNEMLGFPPDHDLTNFDVSRFYGAPLERSEVLHEIDDGNEHFGLAIRRVDNVERFARGVSHPVRNESGEIDGYIGYIQDVTEAEQARRNMEDAVTQFSFVLDNAPVLLYRLDSKGTIEYVNRAAPGMTVDQLIGTSIFDWMPDDLRPRAEAIIKRVTEGGAGGEYHVETPGPSGELTTYACHVTPIFEEGEPAGAVLMAVDLDALYTHDKKMPTDLAGGPADEALDIGAIVPDLVDIQAHSLEVPLRPIVRQLYVLDEERLGPLNPRQRQSIEIIHENVRRLRTFMVRALDLAAMQCGSLQLTNEPVRLDRLLEDEANKQVANQNRNVRCMFEVHGPLVVNGDPLRLKRMVADLITSTYAEAADGDALFIKADSDGDFIQVAIAAVPVVSATVPGGDIAKHRGTESAKALDHQRQMVHACCKAMIEAHGGDTRIGGAEAGGRIVSFRLPAARDRSPIDQGPA